MSTKVPSLGISAEVVRNAFVTAAAHLRNNHAHNHDGCNNSESYPQIPCGIEPEEHVTHEDVKRCSDSGHNYTLAP